MKIFDTTGREIDASGPEMAKMAWGDSAWNGASYSREMRDWQPSSGSADGDNLSELPDLIPRGRDLERNSAAGRGLIQTSVSWINGTALRPIPKPDWRILGKSKEWADEWALHVKSEANAYFNSTDVDATRTDTWGPLSSTALTSQLANGAFLAVPMYLPDSGQSVYGTAIQLIEIDRLSNPMGKMDSDTLRGGVQINKDTGAPEGYWIQKSHPGDAYLGIGAGVLPEWEFVPAFTEWGRRRVIHPYDRDRIGQTRGTPLLSTIMPDLRIGDQYKRAELSTAVANSLIALVVKTNMPFELVKDLFSSPEQYLAFRKANAPKLGPGASIVLAPGDDVESFAPNRSNTAFEAFLKSVLKPAFASVGIPYEVGAKDFANMNYSNARVAINEALKTFAIRRSWFAARWGDPVYHLWFEEAVHLGRIPDCTPDDLYRDEAHFMAWQRVKWLGDGRGWVDPKKEADAALTRIAGGLTSLEKECAEQGEDWLEILEQRDTERKAYHARGMVYPGDLEPPEVLGEGGGTGDDERER